MQHNKFQTSRTILSGRIEFDGGVGGVVVLVVCKVIFLSNPTSVEVRLGRVDIVVGVVTIKLVVRITFAGLSLAKVKLGEMV